MSAVRPKHRIAVCVAAGLIAAGCSATAGSSGSETTSTRPVAGPSGTSGRPNSSSPVPPTTESVATTPQGCRRGDPLANVYHPYRLQIRSRCMTVTGVVAFVRSEDDGDVHVDLSLPPSERFLLNWANVAEQDGQLVAEIVPADQPGCTPGRPPAPSEGSYDYGICTGADIATPSVGADVSVTGPYVLDLDHGWMEIHPVWSVNVIGSTAPTSTNTPTTSPATTPPATGPPGTAAWSDDTNSSGYVDIRPYHTSPGEAISVVVGGATCSTSA